MAGPKKKLLLVAAIVVLVGLTAAAGGTLLGRGTLFRTLLGRPGAETPTIRVSGNIEVTTTEVSFKIPGWVSQRAVDEGDMVQQAQPVATLEDGDLKCDAALREAELAAANAALQELRDGARPEEKAAAKAAMEKAEAAWDDLLAGSRPQEIAAAEAAKRAAEADERRMSAELERASQLLETQPPTISREDFDRTQAAYLVALEKLREATEQLSLVEEGPRALQIEAARAAFEQAKAQQELVEAGPRQTTIQQAEARVAQADAARRLARLRLEEYAILRSPLGGVVLSKNIEPGEYVAPGTPVVTIGELSKPWLRAYINETDLGRVKYGQKAHVITDTYPGKVYEGTVVFIASQAEFTPKNVQTEKERVKLVYRIKINVENPDLELKPGMPADAEIVLEQ